MIALEHIDMQFGGDYLFRDVTFTVRPGDRVALAGMVRQGRYGGLEMLNPLHEQMPEQEPGPRRVGGCRTRSTT